MGRRYNVLKNMVPEEGVEPSWARGPGDFESPASTSFTTPASGDTTGKRYPLPLTLSRKAAGRERLAPRFAKTSEPIGNA